MTLGYRCQGWYLGLRVVIICYSPILWYYRIIVYYDDVIIGRPIIVLGYYYS